MIVFGIHPVQEAVRAGRAVELVVAREARGRVADLVAEARRRRVPVRRAPRVELDRMSGGRPHQGAVAEVDPPRVETVSALVAGAAGTPLVLVLDGIEDPRNLGAIMRTADAAGASGLVRQKRRAAALGATVATASAGALAHLPVVSVVNVARALEELKQAGVWVVGLASDAERSFDEVDLTVPTALVLGAEGAGMRRLVRERCDWLVSIPMLGRVESLNVSVAAGVVLYEAVRQRRAGRPSDHRHGRGGPAHG